MSPLRRLLVAVLALAGALAWGPPVVLALCLGGGSCSMEAETPPCCGKAPEEGTSVDGNRISDCCGCCAKVHVGLGIDGGGVRVETPVAPPAHSPSVVVPAPAAADGFVAPAAPPAPRAPPARILPLRI